MATKGSKASSGPKASSEPSATGRRESTPTDSNDRARRTAADGSQRTGVDIPDAEREILNQPIDKRMKALLEDHRRMGARP